MIFYEATITVTIGLLGTSANKFIRQNLFKSYICRCSPDFADMPENESFVRFNLEKHYSKFHRKSPRFEVNQRVRISRLRNKFSRGYLPTFQPELFIIHKVHTRLPIPMYELATADGNEILQGKFYASELTVDNT